MRTLHITDRLARVVYEAAWEPVRQYGPHYTIGWATVVAEDCTLRFPAILHADGWVATVSDWQSPIWALPVDRGGINLADPASVAEMLRCGSGQFLSARTGRPTIVGQHFARA